MTPKQVYIVMLVVISLLFAGLLGGAYGANNLLVARSKQLTDLKVETLALEQEKLSLVNAKKEIAKNSDLEKIARTIVPQDKDQAEAVREIVNIADDNGVKLAAITFPASNLGSTPGGTTSTTPVASNPKAGALSQLQSVKNIAGVYDLQINIQSDPTAFITYKQFVSFLGALEQNRRTAQVSAVTIQPQGNNRNYLTFSLTLDGYIRP